MLLQEFDLIFINKEYIKDQVLTYFMADFPCDKSYPLNEEF